MRPERQGMKLFRHSAVVLSLLFFIVGITAVELYFINLPSVDLATRLLLLGLLTLNLVALLTLMFFVGKNLFRLYMEKRQQVLGYKFRIKLMTIFVVLTLIPSAFLFVAASGLASNYIDRFFSPQMKESFSRSVELAQAFYDFEREQVLREARREAAGQQPLPAGAQKMPELPEMPEMKIRRVAAAAPDETELVRDAFNGREGTEVVSAEAGDIIRAAVPRNGPEGRSVVVVETVLPKVLTEKAERIKELNEDYLKTAAFARPLRLNYILTLGFLTLMIVFTGLWVSLKISKGITIPIQSLAMATEQVASGNLNVQVDLQSKDEIGLLITSFNQMVKQLKESNDSLEKAYLEAYRRRLYLETILENINSGVIFLSPDGVIRTLNRAACAILNVRQEDWVGKDYRAFIAALHSEELAALAREMEGKEIREIRREVKVNKDGRIATLRVSLSGIRESSTSKALGMLVVFHDLTEIIKAQKATTWQEVARRLAHEIKNPLTPIKLSTERLIKKWQNRDEDFDAVFEKSTKTIIAEVESLRTLVDVFSRYGKMPEVDKAPTDLLALVETAVGLFKGFKDVEIRVAAPAGLPAVPLDQEQFKRVLINIIDNAIKAMDNRGVIDIFIALHENSRVTIDIADSGPGIPDGEKEKLFLPYFSGRKGGTGLGLAIANKIVVDHGGRILVRDNAPRGSVFTVQVPMG